jgi:hypothetical protein
MGKNAVLENTQETPGVLETMTNEQQGVQARERLSQEGNPPPPKPGVDLLAGRTVTAAEANPLPEATELPVSPDGRTVMARGMEQFPGASVDNEAIMLAATGKGQTDRDAAMTADARFDIMANGDGRDAAREQVPGPDNTPSVTEDIAANPHVAVEDTAAPSTRRNAA